MGHSLGRCPGRGGEAAPGFTRLVGSGETNRASGMHEAFKCHVCGLCWQAHAALHNKPVTQALSHWVLYFSSLHSVALCSLASKDWNVQPPNMPEARCFLKQPCSLAKGNVSLGAAPQGTVSRAAAPSTLEDWRLILSCPPVHTLRCFSGSRALGLGHLCPLCRASSRPQALQTAPA